MTRESNNSPKGGKWRTQGKTDPKPPTPEMKQEEAWDQGWRGVMKQKITPREGRGR